MEPIKNRAKYHEHVSYGFHVTLEKVILLMYDTENKLGKFKEVALSRNTS